jgi:tetrapyrrole methylase family protein/MazG family protein
MKKAKKLILASRSPRRQELMNEAGFTFEVIPAVGDEIIPDNLADKPDEAAQFLAVQKGREVAENNPGTVIVAADTIVAIDSLMLGKPADAQEAFDMLKRLSGRTHAVYTGVAVTGGGVNTAPFSERTDVTFHELTDDEIRDYIATGEPFDKAGAYGIQGRGMLLVKRIDGDFYNVMGLPIARVSRLIGNIGRTVTSAPSYDIDGLLAIMKRLRAECPWDREQTHSSIRVNVIEEAYEVADAIDNADMAELCEELGDLLLQVVFHAEMACERGEFSFADVCKGVCEKLVYRHPHIYADNSADTTEQVLANWETLKAKSKGDETTSDRLEGVPKALPALMRGEKVGKRAAGSGFDFENAGQIIDCINSEVKELELAIMNKDEVEIEAEFGDVLFSCCNLGRFLQKDCEKALTQSVNRFIIRFRGLEDRVLKSGRNICELSHKELDELWQLVKKEQGFHQSD